MAGARKVRGSAATTRQRKVSCPECGYTVRMTRSWMACGLPVCPCGAEMRPDAPADLGFVGLITEEHVPSTMWTAICRENGWDDAILRRGAAAKAYNARRMAEGGSLLRPRSAAAHCAYPGCWRWVANGAERCAAGHAQHERAAAVEPAPF